MDPLSTVKSFTLSFKILVNNSNFLPQIFKRIQILILFLILAQTGSDDEAEAEGESGGGLTEGNPRK